jgi:hypothetical protein
MTCRLAFFPLAPPAVYQEFVYHAHDPNYPMGDVPNETVVWTDQCLDPANGLNLVEYDPVGQMIVVTPIDQGGADGVASLHILPAPAPPSTEALEQKDEWESVDAPTSPLVTRQSAPGIPAFRALG